MSPKHSKSNDVNPILTLLYDKTFRSVVYQILVFGGVFLLGWYLVGNTMANLESQNIATGFGFLEREAAFGIKKRTEQKMKKSKKKIREKNREKRKEEKEESRKKKKVKDRGVRAMRTPT